MTTIGTHNLHDRTGTPTPFADVILFTEAIPDRVRSALGGSYALAVCPDQRDLVIAWRRGVFTADRFVYEPAHLGVAKVSPHRGTWAVYGRLGSVPAVLVVEHRINAAFPPFRRGERVFRRVSWRLHTRTTLRLVRRAVRRGLLVVAGGDLNTPRGVSGYRGVLHETPTGLDRLGASVRLTGVRHLGAVGSDHPRLIASLGGRT